jgi:hypothetical protein
MESQINPVSSLWPGSIHNYGTTWNCQPTFSKPFSIKTEALVTQNEPASAHV